MSDLAAFQRRFVNAVVRGEDAVDLAAQPGFDVYRRNVVFAAADAFELIFPTVRTALGLRNLRYFVRELLTRAPPASASWLDAGRPFPAFLADRAELRHLACIGDLAQLDWLVARALRRPRVVPERIPAAAELAAAPSAAALVELSALHTCFPIAALRKLPEQQWERIEPSALRPVGAHWVCVCRRRESVAVRVVQGQLS